MPIYEYEPIDRDCLICDNRLELLQSINGDSKTLCPYCGMDIKRIVSKAAFKMEKPTDADRAAAKGFTTYKRSEKGVWEKQAGEGADFLVGAQEDIAKIEAEKQAPAKVLDLDKAD
ncbi:MAG: FmdB family zinc ribbon protein [Fimbriimonas sp.]|jgi:putative FmdB family regulatory protein